MLCVEQVHYRAHRFALLVTRPGGLPDGMVVMHTCDRRNCVNPAHLKVTTPDEPRRVTGRRGGKPGEGNGRAKLTAEKVVDARRMAAEGASIPEMAKTLGVTVGTARRAIVGKSWR